MHGKIGMKNTYTIYKYEEGQKVILAHFHNIILTRMKQMLTNDYGCKIHSIWFGEGSTEPAASDTKLTKEKWTFSWNYSNIISTKDPYLSEDGTWNVECTAKVDATSAYTGTVSEVGLYMIGSSGGSMYLCTHALIKDAEGNPMTITKTDTEVLYVDIHIQYQLSEGAGFTWTKWYYYLIGQGSNTSGNWPQIPALNSMKIAMLRAYPDMMTNGNRMGSEVLLTQSFNTNTDVLTCSNGRFGTDNGKEQEYVNAIGLIPSFWQRPSYDYYRPNIPIGYWTFPNAEIFPNQTLENMRVGVGDGETKSFDPPLYLWVKDSEKIYVDGVLQIRGVDYTCDHRNNLGNLYCLHPSNFCTLKNEMVRQSSVATTGMGYHPLKGGGNDVSSSSSNERRVYLVWDKDHPLEWELNEDPQIGIDADYFQMNAIMNTAGSYNYWRYAVFIISYSNDGNEWTEAGRWTCPDNTASATHRFDFENTVKARHWKLEVDVSGCSDNIKNGRFYSDSISYLHRNGSPIVFTKAPAADAIITMSADIDRPMKNANFIMDVNPTFQL